MKEKKLGKVYIVGAGCGDAELITWKGLRLLRQCDVVLYAAGRKYSRFRRRACRMRRCLA